MLLEGEYELRGNASINEALPLIDLAIPKTYIYGTDSANDEVLQQMRDVTTIRIPDADHLLMEDQPEKFTQTVTEWLQPLLGHKTTST